MTIVDLNSIEAWARAEQIKQRITELRAKAGLGPRDPANEGSRRLLAAAAQGERLDKRLWTGAALATGARGNTTSLVGTPEQVAEAIVLLAKNDYVTGETFTVDGGLTMRIA